MNQTTELVLKVLNQSILSEDNHPSRLHQLAEDIAREIDSRTQGSVLQDWVMKLPLRAQGTLLTGVRGCDVVPKLPLDSTARQLTGFLRWLCLNPADPREVSMRGAFFQAEPPSEWRASELGHLPLHWYSHVMHCYEVVAYYHPDQNNLARLAFDIYAKLSLSLHLTPETKNHLLERLTEDRIANDTVVS